VIPDDPAPAYRVLLVHIGGGPDTPVAVRSFAFAGRYVAVPSQCPDCSATPATVSVEPDDDYHAALVLVHDDGCPMMRSLALRDTA